MRKIIGFLVMLALIAGMTPTAFAAEPKLQISDASAKPGDTVYLTVSLTEGVMGDTMGITYTYDKTVLEVIPSACTWEKKGVLQDFGSYDDSGVWTAGKAELLSGDICVLTFRVKPGVNFTGTDVECTLLVKNGSEKAGEFTAVARIGALCEHTYGEWEDAGTIGHSRSCGLCGGTQTSSHSWDEGTREPDPEDDKYERLIRTCGICGGTRTDRVIADNEENEPTLPEATEPPETEQTAPTMPEPEVLPTENRIEPPRYPTEPTEPEEHEETKGNQNSGPSDHIQGNSQSQINQNQGNGQPQNGSSQSGQPNREPERENQQSGGSGNSGSTGAGEDSNDHSAESTESVEGDFHVHINENGEYIIHEGREHTDDEDETVLGTLPTDGTEEDHTGHEHSLEESGNRTEGAIAVAAALLALGIGAFLFLRKKKR